VWFQDSSQEASSGSTITLDLDQIEAPIAHVFTGSGWKTAPATDLEIDTGIKVWRAGPRPQPEQPREPIDPALQRQLRALGYLN
jgi:hypothetical protein